MIKKPSNRGGARENAGRKNEGLIAITPRVLPETAETLRSISEREKISIGKVIDALAKLHE